MSSRLATDAEVETWRDEGWVLLEGLVGAERSTRRPTTCTLLFPSAEGVLRRPRRRDGGAGAGRSSPRRSTTGPKRAPASGPTSSGGWARSRSGTGVLEPPRASIRSSSTSPSGPSAAPTSVSTRRRPAPSTRVSPTTSSRCTPTATIRGSRPRRSPWWNLEGFLYLSDVTEDDNPTSMCRYSDSAGHGRLPVVLPRWTRHLRGRATVPRSTRVVSGLPVGHWHRGAAFGRPDGRSVHAGLAFKRAGQDWIGYDTQQSRPTGACVDPFRGASTPRGSSCSGFPERATPSGTRRSSPRRPNRYPKLDYSVA